MKINYNKETPLLQRNRVSAMVEHEGKPTPTKTDVIKQLAEGLQVKEETIALRHVYTRFGGGKSKVIAHVYKDETVKKQLEPQKKEKKEGAKT